ncbi:MAG TPA: zf-HC2 domain-containing protein [Vicinamibacteria bacterium]
MIFEHLRSRRAVSLLAAGALEGREAEAARRHLARCAKCRTEHDEIVALLKHLGEDPVRGAEPALPLPVLVDLVQARVTRTLTSPRARWGWRLLALPVAAAAALAAIVVVPPLVARFRPAPVPTVAEDATSEAPALSEVALARLERNLAREQAARYLADAQDVLVNVAATPRDCDREETAESRVDLAAESRRSRELLARKTLLVEADLASVRSARPVLEDVEDMLREVAALEACTRTRDVARVRDALEKRQLLMKMRLMERELLG